MLSKLDIKKTNSRGFTVIEILVVIVIIAILATISFIVYSGITRKAAYASMEAEANNLSKQLAMYSAENGGYPSEDEFNFSDDCDTLESEDLFCFETDYYIDYGLDEDDYWFEMWPVDEDDYDDEDGNNEPKPCYDESCWGVIQPPGGGETLPGQPTEKCPTGFIPVPGSARYSQPGFCVMKYEAKNVNGKAVSQAAGAPWVSGFTPSTGLNQDKAMQYARNACDGCHLITESQWMTLAADIVRQKENWVSGVVGQGQLYNGLAQSNILNYTADGSASSNDKDGWFGVSNNPASPPGSADLLIQRRTYRLSNGEIIWDLSGGHAEFTAGQVSTGKPSCSNNSVNWFPSCSYGSINDFGDMDVDIRPGLMGIGSITNNNATGLGLGSVTILDNDNELKAVIRGVHPQHWLGRGLLEVNMTIKPNQWEIFNSGLLLTGFRVTKQ